MAQIASLRDHLTDELADILDGENQLIKALPKLAEAADSPQLRNAFQKHLKETRGHAERVKRALEQLGEDADTKTCKGMKGLLDEGEKMMGEAEEGPVRDAIMIVSAQKVEHYEMASYGTVRTYANVLGETEVSRLMEEILEEEKAADLKLTQIAEGGVNEAAAEHWQSSRDDEEGVIERSAKLIRGAAGGAVRATANAMGNSRASSSGRGSAGARRKTAARRRSASSRRAKSKKPR